MCRSPSSRSLSIWLPSGALAGAWRWDRLKQVSSADPLGGEQTAAVALNCSDKGRCPTVLEADQDCGFAGFECFSRERCLLAAQHPGLRSIKHGNAREHGSVEAINLESCHVAVGVLLHDQHVEHPDDPPVDQI